VADYRDFEVIYSTH